MAPKRFLILLVALIILGVAGAVYYKMSRETFTAGQGLSEEQVADIIEAVGRHLRLPEGEEPLVAAVTDIQALAAEQAFYRGAENGDILLVYPQIGKAILYDPEGDVLINVGPIIVDQGAGTTTTSPNVAPAPEPEEDPNQAPETI